MTNAYEWNGSVGDVWAAEWRRTDRSFGALSPHLEAAILTHAPAHGRFVDIGCGAGETSLAIATARPAARVTGIDISPGLIDAARGRSAAAPNLDFALGDVQAEVAAYAPIDLFFSRHGVMFFDDPVVAFTTLRQSAAPGATLIFSCFRDYALNSFAAEIAVAASGTMPSPAAGYVPGPYAFADPDFVRGMLLEAGWRDAACTALDFGYRVGEGPDAEADALSFFQRIGPAAATLRAASPDARSAMLDRVAQVIHRHHVGDVVDFPAAAWLWSAKA